MLEKLKEAVCEANLKLVEYGLVIMTWGNVSAISEDGRFVVIKPSGVDYSVMEPGMMTVVDMDGSIVEGELRPSSDLPTHLELYRSFAGVRYCLGRGLHDVVGIEVPCRALYRPRRIRPACPGRLT